MTNYTNFLLSFLLTTAALSSAWSATTYYVAQDGNDANDGLSKETAKATIAAGMACLSAKYDKLVVCDGTYENADSYVLSNGWNVVSENGPEYTKIIVTKPHTMFTWRTGVVNSTSSSPSSTVQGFTVEPKDGARFKFCFANFVYDQGTSLANASRYSRGYGFLRDCVFRNLGTMKSDTSLVVTNALYPVKTMTNPPIVYDGLPNSMITNCVFEGCQAYGDKGAALYVSGNASIILTDSKFIACSGHASDVKYSGTICMPTQGAKIRNCLIAHCTNTVGAAGISIYNMGNNGNLWIESTTIAFCMTTNSSTMAAGIYDNLGSGTSPRLNIRNCLIYGCENTKGPANTTTPRGAYNCAATTEITPYVAGENNILLTASPFKDEANGDFSLKNGPCVDAGLNQTWMNGVDLAGNPRKYNGTVDIGCYEYVPGALNAEITATPNTVLGANADVTLEALADGEYTGALTYAWTVTDHSSGTTVATASGTDRQTLVLRLPLGEYDVALTVTDEASQSVSKSETALFAVVPAAVYVAPDSTPAFPYDTAATAFHRLEDALDFAVDGMEIVFATGVHTNTRLIDVTKAVTIRGENGAASATLVSTNFSANAYMLRLYNAGATVRDLTLCGPGLITSLNGQKVTTAGNRWRGIYLVTGGTLADCVFTNFAGSHIVYGEVSTAVVSNCLFTGNAETGGNGLIGGCQGALFTHCRFLRNRFLGAGPGIAAGFISTMRNCLIAENVAEASGGNAFVLDMYYGNSMDLPLVESCTIASNRMTVSSSTLPAVRNYCGFIRNCIMAYNTLANGSCKDFALSSIAGKANNPSYNVTTTAGTVEDCVGSAVGDPHFRNLAQGNYRLKSSSTLCLKAGQVQEWMAGAGDLDGNPRLLKGAVDIGCYQNDVRPALYLYLK